MKSTEREIAMYGKSKQDIISDIENSITYKLSGIDMVICSYLSDCQEMNEHNLYGSYTESIRKTLNIAKMLITEYKMVEQ